MAPSIKEYDTRIDSKRRITLRGSRYAYYHVSELEDGKILLEPRELTEPFSVSERTLAMMDAAVLNMRAGKVSDPIDLSAFAE